ncbi:MAG: hypothetical protein LBI03_08305 [Clostridiales bacterium]|jgi:hypothetical protein|nr:hypothetical protein [Clostridiales bacterium]
MKDIWYHRKYKNNSGKNRYRPSGCLADHRKVFQQNSYSCNEFAKRKVFPQWAESLINKVKNGELLTFVEKLVSND